jgi:N-acetylmuramoyl-L-alanine amidase
MNKYCVYYDAGHGGINPQGLYTTAPSKMFEHTHGNFHKDSIFYEGVKNRIVANLVIDNLEKDNIKVIKVYHEYNDTPLSARVNTANTMFKAGTKGIYISEHSNATGDHSARGISVWTSEGQTQSDVLAEDFIKRLQLAHDNLGISRVMTDSKVDKDMDYEANFYVLKNTIMPSVLIENLFFDNYEDACMLMSEKYLTKYALLQTEWIKWCLSIVKL